MHKHFVYIIGIIIVVSGLFSCGDFIKTFEDETYEINEIDDIGVGAIAGEYPDDLTQTSIIKVAQDNYYTVDTDTIRFTTLAAVYDYIDSLGHCMKEATFRQIKSMDLSYKLKIAYSTYKDGTLLEEDSVIFDHGPIAYDSTDYVKTFPDGNGGVITPYIEFTKLFTIDTTIVDTVLLDEVEEFVGNLKSESWIDSMFVSAPKYNYTFRIASGKQGYCTVLNSDYAGIMNVYLNDHIDFKLISTTTSDTLSASVSDQMPLEALVEYYTAGASSYYYPSPDPALRLKLTFNVENDNYLVWIKKTDQTQGRVINVSFVRE